MKYLLFTILIFTFSSFTFAQETKTENYKSNNYIRLMFYNVENLFDTKNDSIKNDDEFLPTQGKFWTPRKYYTKINQISKVITAVGGWDPPAIVGLCEVECRYALNSLVYYSALKKLNYKIIHKESPDFRGIDVALLYQEKKFNPILYKAIEIKFPFAPEKTTRDILYVKGTTKNKDTLHIFINHWPSRWGGQLKSEIKRTYVASVLKKATDSIFDTNKNAKIVIMGDLNDYPDNKSLTDVLQAKRKFENIKSNQLYNLAAYIQKNTKIGTHKHHGVWGVLDQIIISGSLFNKNNKTYTSKEDAHIFNADFLLTDDKSYLGKQPFRTYLGFKYIGGYSDHLPVYIDLFLK